MSHCATRRTLLLTALSAPLLGAWSTPAAGRSAEQRLARLESASGGRLGVQAIDTGSDRRIAHRASERFPMCSTFKFVVAAAALHRTDADAFLRRTLVYTAADIVPHSPITEPHVGTGMTVAELCAATIQYSDNAAANVLMRELGGPAAITAFARAIGDDTFRLDRWETELNSAIPGDERDTTTPQAMAGTLQRLVLGDALRPDGRAQLRDWLLGNTTGGTRIRAGLPADWKTGDKTGAGSYGTVNDVAVIWPPGRAPIVLAVYFTQRTQDAPGRNDVIASAAKIVADAWA